MLFDVGADEIDGGDGDDVIFGDMPNTDTLSAAEGLSLLPGSGWFVFDALEAGQGTTVGWDQDDSVAYLRNLVNWAELSADGRGKSDTIDGGAGNDVIFSQGGDDILTGGTGADTFVHNLGNGSEGTDSITDFDFSDGDRLSFFDVVDIGGPEGIDASDLIASYINGGSPGAVDTVTLVNGTIINITDVDDAFSSATDVFTNSIINGA